MLYSYFIWMNASTQQDCYLHLCSSSPAGLALVLGDCEVKLKTIWRGRKPIQTSLLSLRHHFLPTLYV